MKHLGNFVALLILAVNALFTGLLLFTAYSPHIQPVTHPVQSCLGLTFPVFLMINAGFLIFWLVIQRYRSALLPLIGMLLCYSQIRTYLPINFHTDHLPETSIKLLSYNIMGFDGAAKQDGKNPILTYLKESGADILCLQEYSTVQSSKHLSQKDVERELKAYPYHRINTVGSGKGHTNKMACYSRFQHVFVHDFIGFGQLVGLQMIVDEGNRVFPNLDFIEYRTVVFAGIIQYA